MVLPRADRVRTRSPRRRVALTCDAASRAACLIGYLPDSQSFIYQTRILGAASRRLSITPNASRKTYSLSPPKCHVRHTRCTRWGYVLVELTARKAPRPLLGDRDESAQVVGRPRV